jgi:hypothetical protein
MDDDIDTLLFFQIHFINDLDLESTMMVFDLKQ